MSGNSDPGTWIERLVGWCVGLLFATILLSCTVHLLQSLLPVLEVIAGIAGLLALIVGVILLVRWWQQRW